MFPLPFLPVLALVPVVSGGGESDALCRLETFDAAWRVVAETHFDPGLGGVDWQAVRTELRPRAAAARSRAELRRTLSAMLERLGHSHLQLIPGERLAAPGANADPFTTAVLAPDLPPLSPAWSASRQERSGRSLGRLAFSCWLRCLLPELDHALVELRTCDGLVLDLRGNRGGSLDVLRSLAGHFFERTVRLGTLRSRAGDQALEAHPRGNPGGWYVEPYLGPLAIVIDETSASASEIFAAALQALGRARVFGARSAGAGLTAELERLPNGDGLLHPVACYSTPDGRVLEGAGVCPDEPVESSGSELCAGHDPQLEAALAWLAAISR